MGVYINSTGNEGMATAGSGDVLAGIIGGLLAQAVNPFDAAVLGVWLHGKSGDKAKSLISSECLTALSLVDYLHTAIKDIKQFQD